MIKLILILFQTLAVIVVGSVIMRTCIYDRMKWLVTGKTTLSFGEEGISAILEELNRAVFRT